MSYLTFLFQTKMCVPIVLGLDKFHCNVSIDQFHVSCRHYGSQVNWSKKKNVNKTLFAFVNTVTQFIYRGSYAHIVT